MCWRFFHFFCTPFFQLNCNVQGQRATHDIAAQRPSFAPPPPSPARVHYNRAGMQKRTVRIHCVSRISHLFHSPFFQLNCYFQGCHAIRDIAADKWIFDRPPPLSAFVHYKWAATQKEWLEYIVLWLYYIFFTHLFSINLLFFGLS